MQKWIEELNRELRRLQHKYEAALECVVEWQPTEIFNRPILNLSNGKQLRIEGEWIGNRLIIYEDENLDRAIHVLHHEFLERLLINDLTDDYVILANSLQNVFKTMTYKKQETRIEQLAKLEDEEYEKIKRNTRKS